MSKKYKEATREEVLEWYQKPPFSYSGYTLDRAMKMYDEGQEFHKIHPYILPLNMKQVSYTGFSNEEIDDVIQIECECGEKFTIAGGYYTLCPKCDKSYRVISYIAQYERKPE